MNNKTPLLSIVIVNYDKNVIKNKLSAIEINLK